MSVEPERPCVLVCDDEEGSLLGVASILEDANVELVLVATGEEALRQVLKHDFATIIMDVHLPGIDGIETVKLIRQRPRGKNTPVIFITATDMELAHAIRVYGVGAVDYLVKPPTPEILRAKVDAFVDLWQQRRQVERQAIELSRANVDLLRTIAERLKVEEELKTTLERLHATTGELEVTNKELEAFSYSVSHDLRAPLRAIDGFSASLEETCAPLLNEEAREELQQVRTGARRMGQLIEDLLGLSRVSRSQFFRKQVAISEIASAVFSRLQAAEPERRVEVIVAPGLTAYGDEGLLRALLENLLSNAWKFTAKTPGARIEFGRSTANPPGRAACEAFFVRDNGAGFDMQHAGKLFAPFQRLHRAEDYPGTGVGLATVKRIVLRHGGEIWGEAAVGQGATFHFTLGRGAPE